MAEGKQFLEHGSEKSECANTSPSLPLAANKKGSISNEILGLIAAIVIAVGGAIVHVYANFVTDKQFNLIYDRLLLIETKLDEALRSSGK
jgi:hypothetical protein